MCGLMTDWGLRCNMDINKLNVASAITLQFSMQALSGQRFKNITFNSTTSRYRQMSKAINSQPFKTQTASFLPFTQNVYKAFYLKFGISDKKL